MSFPGCWGSDKTNCMKDCMKNSSKTTLLLSLILILILSACQPGDPDPVQPTVTATLQKTATRTPTPIPTNTPTPTATPEWLVPLSELEDVEIIFSHPWTAEMAREIEKLVDTFNQTNEYQIFVTISSPGSAQQVFQRSEAGLQDGNAPQIVVAPTEELAYWHKMGNLITLDGYLNDLQYGFSTELIEDFLPLFWDQDILDTHRLGIPISRNANFLVQNLSWAKELGFDIPAMTPQLFRQHTCLARDELQNDNDWQNNGLGGWIVQQDEFTILSWLNTFELTDFPVTETPYAFEQAATLDAFTFLRELFDEDCAWNARNPTHYEYFANRQALYISADIYDLEPIQKTFTRMENEDQWRVIPYPNKKAQPEIITHGDSLGILKSNPTQELASWLFVRWLSQSDQQIRLATVNPGIPVSQSIIAQLETKRSQQWNQVVALLDDARLAPRSAEWRVARFVLQDAAYQIYLANITPVQYPQIISLLDATIADISQQPASLSWE